MQKDAGLDIFTDGEYRRTWWAGSLAEANRTLLSAPQVSFIFCVPSQSDMHEVIVADDRPDRAEVLLNPSVRRLPVGAEDDTESWMGSIELRDGSGTERRTVVVKLLRIQEVLIGRL